MPVDEPSIAEEIVSALVVHLLRAGLVSERDLIDLPMSAEARHLLKALIVEATIPPEPRLRVVPDGGKHTPP